MDLETKVQANVDVEKTSKHLVSPFNNKETVVYYFACIVIFIFLGFNTVSNIIFYTDIRSELKENNKRYDFIIENIASIKADVESEKRDNIRINNTIEQIQVNIKEHEKRILKLESKGR